MGDVSEGITKVGTRRKTRDPMAKKIMSGFPLHRCSWAYDPIVPAAQAQRMVRWLDFVCVRRSTFKTRMATASGSKNGAEGVTDGT